MLSPDVSLVRVDRWQALTPNQRRGFAPLCPDLVIELASPSDTGPRGATALRRKMATYLGLAEIQFPMTNSRQHDYQSFSRNMAL